MWGSKNTLKSLREEMLVGLKSGEYRRGDGDMVREIETATRRPPVDFPGGWSGRLIGIGAAAVMLMGITTGAALTASLARQVPFLEALLWPIPDPTKGPGSENNVRVLADGKTYAVPTGCALQIASPRRGFAQILWVDPLYEKPVRVFPPAPTPPDDGGGIPIEPGKPLTDDNLPEVKRPTIVMVVITPKPARKQVADLAEGVVKALGDDASKQTPQALADLVERSLRSDKTLRKFDWTAIGRTTLEQATPAASPSGGP